MPQANNAGRPAKPGLIDRIKRAFGLGKRADD